MNARLFSEAMNEVNDKYYEEAARYHCQRHGGIKWSVMAACLAAALFTAFFALPNDLNRQDAAPPDNPGGVIADNSNHPDSAAAKIQIGMDSIFLNEIAEDSKSDASRIWYDPELYDTDVKWNKEEVIAYYGKDLTPVYVPDGLIAASGNGTASVILDKNGRVVEDTVWFSFYHDYYEDGGPKLTEDVAAVKGFSIQASRVGLLYDCLYILPENEVKTSDIKGTAVTFGYRSMPYGPYDPDTHEPSGYYDMYTAEFKLDEIEYQMIAEQMEAEEVVKVVSSIICGEETEVNH